MRYTFIDSSNVTAGTLAGRIGSVIVVVVGARDDSNVALTSTGRLITQSQLLAVYYWQQNNQRI